MKISTESKVRTVIEKNTFYFCNPKFQEKYESYINSLKETLLVLKNKIETFGLKKEIFEQLLKEKENGLKALLTLTGFANETLKRIITIARIVDNKELSNLLYKDKWVETVHGDEINEWSDNKIRKMIKDNEYFRKGIVNLFFEGSTVPFISNVLPLFETKKLSISKLNFELPELIDTLVRYKEKGSYSGKSENNPEQYLTGILNELQVKFEKGDLTELVKKENATKRTFDFIIPSKEQPKIFIESTFLITTSSGQGDKAKSEISLRELITKYHPKTKFFGFVDGIGWYVRKSDLKRIVSAFDDVFTFHEEEIERFKRVILKELK